MPKPGSKPAADVIKLPGGGGPDTVPDGIGHETRENPLIPPTELSEAERTLWNDYIEPAYWLKQSHATLAYTYVSLEARFLKDPESFTSALLSEKRRTLAELNLTPAEQARAGVKGDFKPKQTKAERFFGD